jgi:predicted outer membrane repeat protein
MKLKFSVMAALLFCAVSLNAVEVNSEAALNAAIADNAVTSAELTQDVTATAQIKLNRAFTITANVPSTDTAKTDYKALSGGGAVRVLDITTEKGVNLSNIRVINGYAQSNGGAVNYTLTNTATPTVNTINNMFFKDNTAEATGASVYGGAINIEITGAPAQKSSFTITKTDFEGNKALDTAAAAFGGAIAIDSMQDISISASNFTKNHAGVSSAGNTGSQGGAIYSKGSGKLDISGSNFTENQTAGAGGAIYADNAVTAENTAFESNSALDGGALALSSNADFKGTGLTFNKNKADGDGGAVNNAGKFDVNTSKFSENEATSKGGAIFNSGDLKLSATTRASALDFEKNKADDGGAIYNGGKANIATTNFSQNQANASGGAIYNDGELTLSGANTFTGNTAGVDGGAIYSNSGAVTINGTANFSGNSATGLGGAIYLGSGASLSLGGDITFSGNTDSIGANSVYLASGTILNINSGNISLADPLASADGTAKLNINGGTVNFGVSMPRYSGLIAANGGVLLLRGDLIFNTSSFTVGNGVTLDLMGKTLNTVTLNNFSGSASIKFDADLLNSTADNLNLSAQGTFNVADVYIIKDAATGTTSTISLGSNAKLDVNTDKIYYGPLFGYYVSQPNKTELTFTYSGKYNPSILAQAFVNGSAVQNNMLTVNSLLNRLPLTTDEKKLDKHKTWLVPYGAGQKFNFDGAKNVDSKSYGATMGLDFPAVKAGIFNFVPSIFAGYSGARQEYQEVKAYRDGALAGVMGVLFNKYFLTALEMHISNSSVTPRFEEDSDSFDMFAFTAAAKAEFDLPLGAAFRLQPGAVAAYNLINSQNYETSRGAAIDSSKLNNISLAPQVRLMAYINTWRPFVGAAYNFNAYNDFRLSANGVSLPGAAPKDYFEYSGGVENTFIETYSFFVNLSGYAHGAEGFALQAGFRGYL